MTFWISVSQGETRASAKTVAETSDPVIVQGLLASLCRNQLLEDDSLDLICVPGFPAFAQAAIAALAAGIRQEACRLTGTEDADTDQGTASQGTA